MKVLTVASKNFFGGSQPASHPVCFDSEKQWSDWLSAEAFAYTEPRRFPCRDCTPNYREKMCGEGRCYNSDLPEVVRIMKG